MRKGPVFDTTIDRIARQFKTRRISLPQGVTQPLTIADLQEPERNQALTREASDLTDSLDANHGYSAFLTNLTS